MTTLGMIVLLLAVALLGAWTTHKPKKYARIRAVSFETVATLRDALARFPPEYRVIFNPCDCGDMTDTALIEVLEGTTSDGVGAVWIKLVGDTAPENLHVVNVDENLRRCYQCDRLVRWLAPDSRCTTCTRCTAEEVF